MTCFSKPSYSRKSRVLIGYDFIKKLIGENLYIHQSGFTRGSLWHCWWFRNPKQSPGDRIKPLKIMGFQLPASTGFVGRISNEPSTASWCFLVSWFSVLRFPSKTAFGEIETESKILIPGIIFGHSDQPAGWLTLNGGGEKDQGIFAPHQKSRFNWFRSRNYPP